MKKVMFVVVMLLVASACFAQLQSPPSNVVGYVKINALANAGTPFGLPFKFWDVPTGGIPDYGVESTNPSDICGDQLNPGSPSTGDRILRQDNGEFSWRSATFVWSGLLETNSNMRPGRAYFYQNRTASARNFVLAGEVDNSGNYATILIGEGAANPYSWRDSRSVNRDDLNLVASGFTGGGGPTLSDRVVAQTGGTFFWRNLTPAWVGSLVTVEPGQAYYIVNADHPNDSWNYNYDASGNTGPLSRGLSPSKSNDGGSISKIGASPVVKTSPKSARN